MVVLASLAAVVQIHVFAGLRKRWSVVMPSLCQSRFLRLWETSCAVEGPRWRVRVGGESAPLEAGVYFRSALELSVVWNVVLSGRVRLGGK